MWRLTSFSIVLLIWIGSLNVCLRLYSSRRTSQSSLSAPRANSSVGVGRQSLPLFTPSELGFLRGIKIRHLTGSRIPLREGNEWEIDHGEQDERQQHQLQQHSDEEIRQIITPQPNHDDAGNNIHNIYNFPCQQNDGKNNHSDSARLQEVLNDTDNNNALHPISNETHNNSNNNQTQSQQQHEQDDDKNDTIFDDLTRGFSFAALFCFTLYCFHKCCCYTCMRCSCCPDERVLQARMRKLRLMKKRSYIPDNGSSAGPPLDTRKWAEWMRAHRGTVDTAEEDGNYYYSGISAGEDGGVWDANTDDDGSSAWDDETGFVDFEDADTTTTTDGVEMACRSSSTKNAIPELEYGEGEELEDESHDSRLFDAEDGGKGVNREADKFFTGGRRGLRENGGNGIIGKTANKTKHTTASSKEHDEEPDNWRKDVNPNQNIMSEQTFFNALQPLTGRNDTDSIVISVPESNDAIKMPAMIPQATTPIVDAENGESRNCEFSNDDEDMEIMEMVTYNIDNDDRGYDEETDLLGLRSDSPLPLDLEEMSRIEKKLMEDMENAKPY